MAASTEVRASGCHFRARLRRRSYGPIPGLAATLFSAPQLIPSPPLTQITSPALRLKERWGKHRLIEPRYAPQRRLAETGAGVWPRRYVCVFGRRLAAPRGGGATSDPTIVIPDPLQGRSWRR